MGVNIMSGNGGNHNGGGQGGGGGGNDGKQTAGLVNKEDNLI